MGSVIPSVLILRRREKKKVNLGIIGAAAPRSETSNMNEVNSALNTCRNNAPFLEHDRAFNPAASGASEEISPWGER